MVLGHRIAVMSAGRIEQIGSAETLYRQPSTPFVGRFLGTLCEVRGAFVDRLLVPSDTCVNFRPHEIELIAPAPQGLTAKIVSRFFLGDRVRYELNFPDGTTCSAIMPPNAVLIAGEAVSVRWTDSHRPNLVH